MIKKLIRISEQDMVVIQSYANRKCNGNANEAVRQLLAEGIRSVQPKKVKK